MFCTKCGNQIKDGYKFCPKCGTPAFVENEEPKGEVKKDVDEVTKETNASVDSEPVVKTTEQIKKTSKADITSNTKKEETDSIAHDIYNPNPLIEKELDLLRVRKKAEQGDKIAMLRQAFRYEMGIGVEKDTAKANELYEKAGGKTALPLLERSHINYILPDPIYDHPLLSTDETNDDKDNVLRVIPFVKDIILDYAYKVEQDKSQNKFTKEKSIEYRNEFIQRMKIVRDLHPELLLANIDENLTEEDVNRLFDAIKESTSSRYSLKWIPSLYNFSDYIDGNRIDIPSIFDISSNGLFAIRYNEEEEKANLIKQFIFTILLLLPVKKVRLYFVDLASKYEYMDVLRQLNPILYDGKPITTSDQFADLLNRYEERRLIVSQNYGVYPEYCEQNKEIPLPYEFVFLFDKDVDVQNEIRLQKIIQDSKRIGVYFILIGKVDKLIDSSIWTDVKEGYRNQIYTKEKLGFTQLIGKGIDYDLKRLEEGKNYSLEIISRVGLDVKSQVIMSLQVECNMGIDEARYYLENVPSVLDVGLSFVKADNLHKKLQSLGIESRITRRVCDNNLIVFSSISANNDITQGHGQFEVVIRVPDYPENNNYDIRPLKKEFKDIDFIKEKGKNEIVSQLKSNNGITLSFFPTETDADNFIKSLNIPDVSYSDKDRIRLIPYFVKKQKVDQIGIALYIPKGVVSSYNVEKDIFFYLTKIGFSSHIIKQIIDIVYNKINVGSINIGNGKCEHFPDAKSINSCPQIIEEKICKIKLGVYDGFLLPDFLNNKYEMDFGFWGFNKNNNNDLNTAYETIKRCKNDISNIEKELDKYAIQEWGKGYAKEHLAFKDVIEDVAYLEVHKTKRYRIPILQSNDYSPDSLIKPINIAEDEFFTQACVNYINREAEAKEGTQVVTLDFDDSKNSYEDITNELVIDVGKKGKNDMQFRMDLVSHVHSFIIGQSGSGKSVFLHNIIGGAMLKYASEDLQLYLLDFKLGGVEFNRYQGAKHVKALLVDNSDPQVTLEILRELRNSMTERGKLLRNAGVNNIGEYNKLHQQDRMPHVLVVADECHEMFKADDSIPRQVRNEISDIVIKIAKEGRSQGVHLVFATQTLSGTEISSEIINNVSDFYLLKCAQTDSERLVTNSSAITSELSTGQIYYHHVDEQVKFQAYYTDKEAAEKLMAAIVEKAKDHKSNGEFYFNGAQMFYLDDSVKEQMLAVKGKSPLAFMGKAIDISQKDLFIKLNEDFSENVLLLGLNDQEQVTRTTMNMFLSLMMSAKLKHKDIAFKVIDCLNNEEGEVHELIFDLENEGYCDIIERRQRSKFFKELAQGVQDGTAEETILLILGQDRFRELKMDMELEESNSSQSSDDDMMSISDDLFGDSSSSSTSVRTYREALNVILDKGPDYGVHTLLQIEKASNLLFEDYITPKVVFQKFKHLVMLKSDETAGVTLHLNDDIRLEKLSSDWERLRAYYYAEESDSYTLFTPYMPSKSKDIINLLKTI